MHRLSSHIPRTYRMRSKTTRNVPETLTSAHLPCCSSWFSTSSPKTTDKKAIPSHSSVVVCGGGILGASVAYHLAERGWTDVTLLEQGQLTCGTTWHSVGLIGRLKATRAEALMTDYSRRLYEGLEEAGEGMGWKRTGSVQVARTADRMIELRRKHVVSGAAGVESHIITPQEAKDYCPLLNIEDIKGAVWVPHDGVVTAPDVNMTLARLARKKGVKVIEGVSVTDVLTDRKKVTDVMTSEGNIRCDYFVNCGGQWAREIGKKTRPQAVDVPLHSCEHYYMVTKPFEGVDRMMPVIRDPDGYTYFREWNGGLLGGGFEPNPLSCFHDGIPDKFEFDQLPEDWDHFQVLLESMLHRIPAFNHAEVRQLFNGPESFSPDTKWTMGKSPQYANYFLAAGMSSTGIVGAGGIGKCLADWIIDGRTDPDMMSWSFDVQRFGPFHNTKAFLKDRMRESLYNGYKLKYPRQEFWTGRGVRCSPLYAREEALGAVFGETMAYERAMYFDNKDDAKLGIETPIWSFHKPGWFENVQEEFWACKERVGLMDMSSFTKVEVKGSAATAYLRHLCSNDIAGDVGGIVHTGMLNVHGGFENDCTVARTDDNSYLITCQGIQQTRALAWMNSHLPEDGSVQVTDVTSMFSGINLIGPHAHQLLADVSNVETDKINFRPMTSANIDVGHASGVRAMRLTHTGVDGFILFIPSEYALHVYNTLMAAGKDYGIRSAGYYALRHMRIEKLFAYWGSDLDDRTTPLELAPGFMKAALGADHDFLGKAALQNQQKEGVERRFVQFLLEDFDKDTHAWPWGGEPVYRDGKYVGSTSTCSYGFSLDRMVCLAFVGDVNKDGHNRPQADINAWVLEKGANYQIDIGGTRYNARPGIYAPSPNSQARA